MTFFALAASVILCALWLGFRLGKRSAELEKERALRKSAEAVAKASLAVEEEARRTHEAVESVGADTPADAGSRLLSGDPRD